MTFPNFATFRADRIRGAELASYIGSLGMGGYSASYLDTSAALGHGTVRVELDPNEETRERQIAGLVSFLAATSDVVLLGVRDENGHEHARLVR